MSDNKVIKVDFGARKVVDEAPKPAPQPQEPEENASVATVDKKEESMLRLLEKGTVMVTLDARFEGVTVPPAHAPNPNLRLNFDWDFQIPDFTVDAEGVSASLSFGGKNFWCNLPWGSVYMLRSLTDDEMVLFPHSFPPEVKRMHPEMMAEMEREAEGIDEEE